jgi:drug/metabolite transporter (DMT)-like permease
MHLYCLNLPKVNKALVNWIIFVALSIIWGSSFMLIKEGLKALSAYQVASLRIVFAGLVLLPTAIKNFKKIPTNKIGVIILSGMLGSLLPAYLFCIAEEGIDGALAGTLNSLTPIFVTVTGALFFASRTSSNKILGIFISFIGSILLLLSKGSIQQNQNLLHISYVILATIFYGINVNMVQRYLQHVGSLQIAAMAFTINAVPALIVLAATGYFSLPLTDSNVIWSTAASAILGVAGTAVASIIFYMLVKRAGGVFASMVTYGIPVVAIIWGVIYKEDVGWKQVACLAVILLGVYIANRKK